MLFYFAYTLFHIIYYATLGRMVHIIPLYINILLTFVVLAVYY